ncbi:hypothetical protein ACJX0J_036857, partial [Zea mays]
NRLCDEINEGGGSKGKGGDGTVLNEHVRKGGIVDNTTLPITKRQKLLIRLCLDLQHQIYWLVIMPIHVHFIGICDGIFAGLCALHYNGVRDHREWKQGKEWLTISFISRNWAFSVLNNDREAFRDQMRRSREPRERVRPGLEIVQSSNTYNF